METLDTPVAPTARLSFKARMLLARVNRLLAEKGFDAMTVDEVAADVGIAKASLYKHFPSKEDLACAAMVRVMKRAQDFVRSIPASGDPLTNIQAVTRWTLQVLLSGEMPSLPSQNSSLRAALMSSREYMDGLVEISDILGGWIEAAQAAGQLNARLPAIAILYTLFARACDPVVEFLKMGGQHSDEAIVDLVMSTCFDGLRSR